VGTGGEPIGCLCEHPAGNPVYLPLENELRQDTEHLMVIKSNRDSCAKLASWLIDHHPYDVPEVLALPVENATENYLDRVVRETT